MVDLRNFKLKKATHTKKNMLRQLFLFRSRMLSRRAEVLVVAKPYASTPLLMRGVVKRGNTMRALTTKTRGTLKAALVDAALSSVSKHVSASKTSLRGAGVQPKSPAPTVRFPYGHSDFRKIRNENMFFVDNTRYVAELEAAGEFLIFLRPPRFGKSLFMNMLSAYYDRNTTEAEFEKLFKGLDVYERGTAEDTLARSFYVLKFDFSIEIEGDVVKNFADEVNTSINVFLEKYKLSVDDAHCKNNPNERLRLAADAVRAKSGKLYVLVDEYDRFANKLMVERRAAYDEVVAGESGKPSSSPIRAFFEKLKVIGGDGGVQLRSLITGITPIALADASGYNVAKSLTHDESFASLVGFARDDLVRALEQIADLSADDRERALVLMQRYYNGYHFNGCNELLYNPTLSLFFLDKLAKKGRVWLEEVVGLKDTNETLFKLYDDNVAASTTFVEMLRRSTQGAYAVAEVMRRDAAIRDGMATRGVPVLVSHKFTLNELLNDIGQDAYDRALMLMYYHGVVTLGDDERSVVVPNLVASLALLKRLAAGTQFSLKPRELYELVVAPSHEAVHRMMAGFLNELPLEILVDNNFNEAGMHAVLHARVASCRDPVAALSEGRVQKVELDGRLSGRDGYFDLLLTATASDGRRCGVLFEFKRKRPEQIVFSDILLNKQKMNHTRFVKDEIRHFLLSRDVPSIELVDKKLATVGAVVDEAKGQLKGYMPGARTTHKLDQLHGYVVVSVGSEVAVEEVGVLGDVK